MLTVDQLLSFRSVGSTRISPDGAVVVYSLGPALAGEFAEAGTNFWSVAVEGGTPRQLTFGAGKESAPAWSPDGKWLAFLSDRDGDGKRLYLLPRDGGEGQSLDSGAGAIKAFSWAPDGSRIAFLRTDPVSDPGAAEKNAPVVIEESPRYDRLWTIDLATREVRPTTDAAAHVWEFCWLGDGSGLAIVVADDPTAAAWYNCRLARLDLATGVISTLYRPPTGREVARPASSPDGQTVACIVCTWSDPGMSGGDLWIVPSDPASDIAPRNLTAGAEFSVNTATWTADGRELLCHAYAGEGSSIGVVESNGQGGWRELWHGPYSLSFDSIYPTTDGQSFAVPRSAMTEPAEVWLGQRDDAGFVWRQLTTHGDQRAALDADVSEVRWNAPEGLALGGILTRPAGVTGPTPLLVLIHGGPTGRAMHAFSNRGMAALTPLLAAHGIATFAPNFRGSNGRGVAFAEANHGDMGGADWADIIAGVDQLIADGLADPERLGICGWSYGGFMTMWGVTQTTRFKAAVAGAGIANWASFHGASDLHVWDALFYEADPYDPNSIYAARSPIYHSHRVKTPTLVLHGDADRVVPPDQGREFFRALKDRGVETQLVLYPGSGHGPHDPRQIRDVIERSLDWLRDRLLG